MRSNNESGFNLVEMAMVLLIAGLLIGGSMTLVKPYLEMSQANLTRKKMENISRSLAEFAQMYGRLPCPADPTAAANATNPPFGSPRRSGTNGVEVAERDCGVGVGNQIGIIPFRALGLDEEHIRDSYGNLITYAVSPAMTRYDATDLGSGTAVHDMCRRSMLWVDGGGNKNTKKARICCADRQSQEIQLRTSRTGANIPVFPTEPRDSGGNPDNGVTGTVNLSHRFVAFVLISHGPNGDESYIAHETGRNARSAPANAQESENYDDDDLTFVSRPVSRENGSDYFDDIVVWKTNDQLVSIFGNDSCERP